MNAIKQNPKRGRLMAILIAIMPKKKLKPTQKDLQRMEFKTSTKRMGISFTEKIRNNFRKKWLKKR
jgi:hypothetical protein